MHSFAPLSAPPWSDRPEKRSLETPRNLWSKAVSSSLIALPNAFGVVLEVSVIVGGRHPRHFSECCAERAGLAKANGQADIGH